MQYRWSRGGALDHLDFGLMPLREYLSDEVYNKLIRRAHRTNFKSGNVIHSRGETMARFGVVAEGGVRFGRFLQDGNFNLLFEVGPGGHFGDGQGLLRAAYAHHACSIGNTKIDFLDSKALIDLLTEEPSFALALSKVNAARLMRLLDLYHDARTLSVPMRLAKLLLIHVGRGKIANGVACLQRDLSELLGVSSVSVSTALKELENAGLVASGYRQIIVPDKASLEAWLSKSNATKAD